MSGGITYSILLPSLNNLEYLELALKSMKMSTMNQMKDIELIVNLDGYDEDIPFDWFPDVPHTTIMHHGEMQGFSASMNSLVEKSSGKYIIIASDDVIYPRFWLHTIIDDYRYLEHLHNKAGLMGVMCENISGPQDIKRMGILRNKVQPRKRICPVVGMISKAAYLAVGGFDPQFTASFSDDDFCFRLSLDGYTNAYCNTYVFHFGSIATSRHIGLKECMEDGKHKMLKKWGDKLSEFYDDVGIVESYFKK